MSIQVNLPFPGELVKSTIKLDVFDNDGNLVRVDDSGTWYEVVSSTVKWADGAFEVISDIVRIDDNADKLDEPAFQVIYVEAHFTD